MAANDLPETPLPRLRPSIDMVEVGPEYGEDSVCLYDRQDPSTGQTIITRAGLLLASLLDGSRTASAVRATFALRTGATLGAQEISAFVDQLDRANLLDSPRYRETRRRVAREFRARSTRPAVHAGGAYPGDPAALRRFLDARYTMPGGPGAKPRPVSHPS